MVNKYLNNTDLIKELIISQAQGYRTSKLDNYLILLANNTFIAFQRNNIIPVYMRDDILQSSILRLLNAYFGFDINKYDNPFAYYTEVFKRAVIKEIKDQEHYYYDNINKKYTKPNILSINNMVKINGDVDIDN